MPSFRHSKESRVALDGYDASLITTEFEAKNSVSVGDITTIADNDRKYLPGLVMSEYPLAGHADFASTSIDKTEFESKLGGSTSRIVMSMCPEGYTVGRRAILDYVIPTQYDFKSPLDGIVEFSGNMVPVSTGNANTHRATKTAQGVVLLRSTALSTSTSAGATQDQTAASTRGYVAHLHAMGGTIGSTKVVDIEVQHSSNGTTWANLTSITAINASGVYLGSARAFSTSAAVKRYVRGACVTQTSTGEPAVLLTFARR